MKRGDRALCGLREVAGLPAAHGTLAAVLAVNQAEPGIFYAANNHGLYRSADTGLSWERLNVLDMTWPGAEQHDEDEARRPTNMVVVEAS